ncbi:hypothetical protein [Halomonas korlensis]|uniref:Uncharacterized protein n=1 Tax=Halomonas korlensis TaxID=463301 RepID=A0A1I7IXW9_9GAMM|nr:hypothetical protein [Halomonas korlensis]SFU77779.1 hypothetical protein SAMN04487955_108139 [Halomonas korlensis]
MLSSPTQAPKSPHDRLIHAASMLLDSHGNTSTGIATIVKRAAPLDAS